MHMTVYVLVCVILSMYWLYGKFDVQFMYVEVAVSCRVDGCASGEA